MVSKTLTGFKDFLLRGNLVELAVAVIMGTTFGAVVKAFTDMLIDIIGKVGGVPDFSSTSSRRDQRRCLPDRAADLRADRLSSSTSS